MQHFPFCLVYLQLINYIQVLPFLHFTSLHLLEVVQSLSTLHVAGDGLGDLFLRLFDPLTNAYKINLVIKN